MLSTGKDATIWQSRTVVAIIVLSTNNPRSRRIPYSSSLYPSPFPILPPSKETATDPATIRSIVRSFESGTFRAPEMETAFRIDCLGIRFGSSFRKPADSLGVGMSSVFPSSMIKRLTCVCGESGLTLTVWALENSLNFVMNKVAFSEPTKFEMRL